MLWNKVQGRYLAGNGHKSIEDNSVGVSQQVPEYGFVHLASERRNRGIHDFA